MFDGHQQLCFFQKIDDIWKGVTFPKIIIQRLGFFRQQGEACTQLLASLELIVILSIIV